MTDQLNDSNICSINGGHILKYGLYIVLLFFIYIFSWHGEDSANREIISIQFECGKCEYVVVRNVLENIT